MSVLSYISFLSFLRGFSFLGCCDLGPIKDVNIQTVLLVHRKRRKKSMKLKILLASIENIKEFGCPSHAHVSSNKGHNDVIK
jgi:hypothetical protein